MTASRPRAVTAQGVQAGAAVQTGIKTPATQATLFIAAVGLLAASAWLSVPFRPVPITMQTLAVLIVGGLLGPRLGVAAVAGYLCLGLTGVPVFGGGLAGPAVLGGPTGGYLLGFLPAAWIMGCAADRAAAQVSKPAAGLRRLALLSVGCLLAEVSIYALGVPWLALIYCGGDFGQAVTVGVVPFLLGDLLKAGVAIAAVRLGTPHRGSYHRGSSHGGCWESLRF